MHDAEHFCASWRSGALRRSVRWDRCEVTRCGTRVGLICLDRRFVGARRPVAHGPDRSRPSATARNNAPSGQLVGSWTRMRAMCSITRAPILIRRCRNGRELTLGERVCLRDRGAHAMHQPERGGVKNEPHLIGGRAVTRCMVRPCVASGFRREGGERSCINVSDLYLELIVLRAIMDISARASSLCDRPRAGQSCHQCSQAPGRPSLHLV